MRENRTNNEETVRQRTGALTRILIAMLLLTGGGIVSAQPIRVDPRHPGVATLHEWGYMVGTLDSCVVGGEEFGRGIIPVGDISGDGIADFILERYRCDYATSGKRANELLLYHGVRGSLPDASSGQRIGLSEIGSVSVFDCAGDFDADGNTDIVLKCQVLKDTSNGNVGGGYDIGIVVVFWGQSNGRYTLEDTTRLPCDAAMWLGPRYGLRVDYDGDGVDDALIVGTGAGFASGEVKVLPQIYIYRGERGVRWGRGATGFQAGWRWWGPPKSTAISLKDQDCDGRSDIIFQDRSGGKERISILYGVSGGEYDTTGVEEIDLTSSGGEYSLFQDVTGDGMLDLVTWCGQTEEKIRIFAGAKGQRLIEQYGSGTDSADKATGRYPLRPWAEIWMPSRLHDGWFLSEDVLFDLGDLNGDGMSEVVGRSWPFMIMYTTGRTLDSLIDVIYRIEDESWGTMRLLGDIDGSGEKTIGVTYGGRVHFLKAKAEEIPTYGGTFRALPHPEGVVCGVPGSADRQDPASVGFSSEHGDSPPGTLRLK